MYWFFILFALIAALAAMTFYTYHRCFYSNGNRNEDPYLILPGKQYSEIGELMTRCVRIVDSSEYEEVHITSYDGCPLYGRLYETQKGAPVQILFHGYRSCALRDCAGGFVLGKKLNMNLLLVDQRAHGKSGSHTISFGIRERRDALCWAQYVTQRFGAETPILLTGLSMGAATVLMATELPLPENVVGVIADCPYDAPKDIIQKVSRDEHYPVKLVYPIIRFGARLLGRFDLEETGAKQAVQKANIPIMLIHGEDDHFVPCQMSREILAQCHTRAELHTFPGADHGLSYMVDPVRYEQLTVDFLFTIPQLKSHLENTKYAQELHSRAKE